LVRYVNFFLFCLVLTENGFNSDDNRFLRHLNLQDNNLQGSIPASVAGATRLQSLILSSNMLIGEIPSEVFTLPDLRVFDVSHNALSGRLIEQLPTSLEALIINNNQLTGPLPVNLGLLGNLHIAHIQTNNFNGSLPATVSDLLNVTSWDLTSNNFDRGQFLPDPLCPFCSRVYTPCNVSYCGNDCVDGFLLACTTPRAFQISRTKAELDEFDCKAVRSMRRIIDAVPEQCVYRFD
jgi:hypothetical protein